MHDDSGPRNEFLHRLLDDRDRGRVQTVEHYQRLFPGAAAAIAEEYAVLVASADTPAAPPDAAGEGLAPGASLGPYRLRELLGAGAFGVVWRAEDTRLQRSVALKLLRHAALATARERERFAREAAVASRLDHPGICTVHEIAQHGPWTAIAMRLVPGETLAAKLARAAGAPLPVAEVLPLVAGLARALHAAHTAGVVHRDVKPGNVLVTPAQQPVLVDFGLARALDGERSQSLDGAGSPSYMAPEAIDPARGPVDARTDVWALGVLAHECLTGRRPFVAPTQAGLFDAILHHEPAPVPCGRDLAVVVATALAKERAHRYASAAAFADDLEREQRGEPVAARPLGRLGRAWRWARRNRLVAALLVATFGSLAAGLVVALGLWAAAARNLRDWERLADGRRLAALQRAADDELLPITPEQLPGIDRWLATARELLARQADHAAALQALRARARPWTAATAAAEAAVDAVPLREVAALAERRTLLVTSRERVAQEPASAQRDGFCRTLTNMLAWVDHQAASWRELAAERSCYEFDDLRDQIQHDQLAELVRGLQRLVRSGAGRTTTIASMEQRREAARTLWQRTIGDHAAAWAAAAARVLANPAYRGLVLLPQLGLVPLGVDPASGLEEFAAPETGDVPPRRGGVLERAPTTAVVFVLLPPGRFAMGAQATDPAAPNHDALATGHEGPVRWLDVDPFLLAKYELTQGQWVRLCDDNPCTFPQGTRDGEHVVDLDHPLETVSWHDVRAMLARLGWWLPPEARWEYACRAGGDAPFGVPEAELVTVANVADRRLHAWQPAELQWLDVDDGHALHAPVGSYRANAFGLHDMLGNVAEWCFEQDLPYDPARTTATAVPHQDGRRTCIVRGGSFLWGTAQCRVSARTSYEASVRSYVVGVRAMRALVRS
jgi:formylglycine-generating enzyme required for sulfatase activity/tRNA A-37 threonylcarbamoyl transferase component Bud32